MITDSLALTILLDILGFGVVVVGIVGEFCLDGSLSGWQNGVMIEIAV